MRKIIHIDMDAFFASVEQRDFPELKGKPVAVGSDSERGVVATASYEARRFGVRSAMSSVVARRKCPHLVFVKPRFDAYKAVSDQIMQIFYDYTDMVEPLSIDEAFLDVTVNKKINPSATLLAREIKARILSETGLTATAGVSFNKFLAKTATEMQKPDGLTVITPERAEQVIHALPIEKFYGIGPVTAKKMHLYRIHNGKDLQQRELAELVRIFGKSGVFFYHMAQGDDNRPVEPEQERKSLGVEYTFDHDLTLPQEIDEELFRIARELAERSEKSGFMGKTLTLKVKLHNFTQHTRCKTLASDFNQTEIMYRYGLELFQSLYEKEEPVRLLGLSLSNSASRRFCDAWQLSLDLDFGDSAGL